VAEYSLLPKAPIKEALIDIRVKIKDGINSEIFLQLYDNISNQYPKKTTRHKREGKIEFKKGEPPITTASDTVLGYSFVSSDGKQIFQARIDGFTFSRLDPYDRWETLRDEAIKLWRMYKELTTPEIIRVALRYINKFNIPVEPTSSIKFEDYLTSSPIIPEKLPQGVGSFLSRVVIDNPEIDAAAIVTQVFEGIIDPKFIPIILDIDVIRQKAMLSEEEAWETLEKLRNFKNNIFFENITEKTKELFR